MTALLTGLAATAVVLTAAARIPRVVTELIRACIPLIAAIHELRTALVSNPPTDMHDKKTIMPLIEPRPPAQHNNGRYMDH